MSFAVILQRHLAVDFETFFARADPPEMEETEEGGSSRLTSLAQSTISLTCRANGQPSPNITWTKEAKRY
jgi:hypothetical protein